MMNIEIPQFWHLTAYDDNKGDACLTIEEIEYRTRLEQNVLFLTLKSFEDQPPIYQLAETFSKFGDIKIIKESDKTCFIELQDVDWIELDNFLSETKKD